MKKVLLVAAMSIVGIGSASANELIVNGSFEAQAVTGPFGYNRLAPTGWTSHAAVEGIVLFNDSYQPVADGLNAIQLERPGDFISQSFSTIAGQRYQVSFALSGYHSTGQASDNGGLNLRVTFGDTNVTVAAPLGNTPATQTLNFYAVAGTTSSTLKFESLGTILNSYPQLDNVSVSAVPEPETYALMLAGLAGLALLRRRKD
ncbi:MAG: hypothetical protein RL375_3620 [Pseudomonadota bacterium]